jgi:alpha-ketoglutarate-dependent taurine dioxygenase
MSAGKHSTGLLSGWDEDGKITVDQDSSQHIYGEEKPFPLIIKAKDLDLKQGMEWVTRNKDNIDQLLVKYGVVYFRGFGPKNAQEFNDFVECFGYENFPYIGGNAVRVQLAPRVFTTNEAPPSEPIPFHHELAQTPNYPKHLFFFCEVEPGKAGETSIMHAQEFYEELRAKFPEKVEELDKRKVRYIRVLSEDDDSSSAIGRGWKNTYNTDEKSKVEAQLNDAGYNWEWLPNGNLKTISPELEAIKFYSKLGKKVYHNQLIAAFTGWIDSRNDPKKAIVFGDKSAIDVEFMNETVKLAEKHRVNIPWKSGDVMLIDNMIAMHARMPFERPRKVLASMAK